MQKSHLIFNFSTKLILQLVNSMLSCICLVFSHIFLAINVLKSFFMNNDGLEGSKSMKQSYFNQFKV